MLPYNAPAAKSHAAAYTSPSTIDLSGFAVSHRQQPIPAVCDHVGRGLHRRCDRVSPNDVTTWCFPCFRAYILDRREGAGDCRAGDFDGHPESLEVIADAMVDLSPYGPWGYREEDDPEVCERMESYDPTDADLAELRRLMGDPDGRDHDGLLSPEEQEIELFSMGDGEWASEYLDPEAELASMAAERELIRRIVEVEV